MMQVEVELEYNPYLPELKLSVNGKMLSDFNALSKYRHSRFSSWCAALFDEIYRELHSEYHLRCFTSEFVGKCLQEYAEADAHCLSFQWHTMRLNENAYDRLTRLELLGCDTETEIIIPVFDGSRNIDMLPSVFELLEDQEIFSPDEHGRMRWHDCPLVNVDLQAQTPAQAHGISIAFCSSESDISCLSSRARPLYALIMSDKTVFRGVQNDILIFNADPDELSALLMNIIEEDVLAPVLSELSYQFEKSHKEFLTPKEQTDLMLLCSISPICHVELPEVLLQDRQYPLDIDLFPSNEDIYSRVLSSDENVITVVGSTLIPVSEGRAEVSVFLGNDPHPISRKQIRVKNKTLIRNISIFPALLYLPQDAQGSFQVTVYPENAENADELRWASSDLEIAEINVRSGRVYAHSEGYCNISVSTPECCAEAKLCVQPALKDLLFPESELTLRRGERHILNYRAIPENAYGLDMLRFSNTSPKVAEYRGGYVVAKNAGKCTISIELKDRSRKWEIFVTVRP